MTMQPNQEQLILAIPALVQVEKLDLAGLLAEFMNRTYPPFYWGFVVINPKNKEGQVIKGDPVYLLVAFVLPSLVESVRPMLEPGPLKEMQDRALGYRQSYVDVYAKIEDED